MIMKDRKESMHTYYFIIMLSTYWAFFHTSPNKKSLWKKRFREGVVKEIGYPPPPFFRHQINLGSENLLYLNS